MSVLPSDLVTYGSIDMPEADGVIVGGAVDFTTRVAFYDITPTGTVDVISSSASDTATQCHYYGRDATGVIQNQSLTLNGQTWVAGSQSLERLLYAAISGGGGATKPIATVAGTAAVGDVALAAHSCVLPSGSVTTDTTVHTAQAGSANAAGTTPALFKLQSGDGTGVSAGQMIWIKGGTGANQLAQIIATSGYGTDVVAVGKNWGAVPDATSTYKILQGMMFEISPNKVTCIIRAFSTAAADVPDRLDPDFLREGFCRQQQHRDGAERGTERDRKRDAEPPLGRAAGHRAVHGARRCQHDDHPPDRSGFWRRLVRQPAGLRPGAGRRQPALGLGAQQRRRAGRVVAADPAGRHCGLQGRGGSAHPRDDDLMFTALVLAAAVAGAALILLVA